LSAVVRSKGLIVFNVASSGIAALLLPGGKTVHSTLTVPIEIKEASTLTMEKDSHRADLGRAAKLIIWDEAPMSVLRQLTDQCVISCPRMIP